MATIECPFCDRPVELDLATAIELTCDACLVRVEFAAEPAPVIAVAAA